MKRSELYKQAFDEHAKLVERVKQAEAAHSQFQDYAWQSLGKWMDKLKAGIGGHQPEAWAIMDMAVDKLLKLQDENAQLKDETTKLRMQLGKPVRRRLPDTRPSIVHKFSVADHEGYLTVGLFDDGSPGELFITMAKEGSTVGGLMDTIGRLTSVALQSGVPIDVLAGKFIGQRFEPSGYTTNAQINRASSIIYYVFSWLDRQFSKEAPAQAA